MVDPQSQNRRRRNELAAPARRAYALALVLALLPPVGLLALGAQTTLVALTFALALVASMALVGAQRRWTSRDYDEPIRALIAAAHEIRQGALGRRMAEDGAPAARALTRMLNEAWATVDERSRRSEANLLSVEMQFDRIHSVLQSLAEGVIVVDMLGEVLLANPAARALMHGGNRPIEGRALVSLLTGALKERLADCLAQMNGQQRQRAEVYGLHAEEKVYDVSVVRVRSDRPDHDFGSVVVLMDVTRNHEIARLKDEFLSTVSHELRTPLTNICAYTEILAQMAPGEGDDWREFLGIVGGETRRLKKLVDDVLDFSNLEAGRVQLQKEQIDVLQVVKSAVDHLAPRAAKQRHVLELVPGGGPMLAWADRERLQQVIHKVLDNAVKFTPDGGRIRVLVESLGEQVEVSVADSGKGVAIEQREAVFDKFHQIGDVLSGKPQGQGLSLAICRRLVDAMGGMIWCEESELGGALFRFVLPSRKPEPFVDASGVHLAVEESRPAR